MGGSLEFSEIENIIKFYPNPEKYLQVFVETGTYKGDTTFKMAKKFKQVYTCEIHNGLLIEACAKAQNLGIENIKFFQCDSVPFLREILSSINDNGIYFLDAHISGTDSSWNGYKCVPLMEELECILEHKGTHSNIIIIDDSRFFDGTQNSPLDWSHISIQKINTLVEKYTKKYFSFVTNDRMFILLN